MFWDGKVGGTQRCLYQLVRAQLDDPDLAPAVIFAEPSGPYYKLMQELGVEVISLGAPHSHSPSVLPRATRVLAQFELHHFHAAEPLLMMASLCCRGPRRYYTHRGGLTDYPAKQRFRYRFTGLLVRRFTGLSANTAHGAASAAQLLGIDRERFAVTYNGLDFDLLEPRTDRTEMQQRLRLRDGSFVVGTVAHLRPWKRIDRLIEAVATLEDPGVQLLIVGPGEDRPRLESLAARRDLNGQVVFAGEQAHVGDCLQLMDAFCLPSTGLESFGNAAVEAMAAGVPSIVFSDGGGLLEHIVPGESGLVVENDVELVRAIRSLIDDPQHRSSIGAAGREAIRAKYTLAASARRYRELYGLESQPTVGEPIAASV